ncbi:MAG TPA: MotA/TolQ/ExbB proton channel family protein [Bacteroidales bacterium]|nr:MotA/TolQ/ExbB proton channel family protein [Bacteroidales bacterium]
MINTILLQAGQAATEAATQVQNTEGQQEMSLSIWDLTLKGGWIMVPLALLSVIAIYIFVERFLIITRATKTEANFMNNIRDFIHDGKIDSAVALCKSTQGPLARMIEKGVARIGKPLNDINAAIENVGKLEVSKLEKNVATLATVAGAAPMIGFLGTVMGMVKAFYDMAMAGNNIDIALLSTGIYQAMITTIAGLIVGIIAYICYNILVARIEKVIFLLEARATEFMDVLNEPAK